MADQLPSSVNKQDVGYPSSPPQNYSPAPSGYPAPTPSYSSAGTVASTVSMDVLDSKRKLVNGDQLSYRVVEERTDPHQLRITDSGEMEVPLIGRVQAAGKTCKQLALDIKSVLEKDYFYHATVILGLDSAGQHSNGTVYIMGQVKSQGPMQIPLDEPSFTVSKAILRAGGFADFADERKVKLVRKTDTGSTTQIIDVKEILQGHFDKDVVLQPDDLVIIPQRLVNF